jgi:molybdopterin converting factor small subunit
MVVRVKVFASLRHYLPSSEQRIDEERWDFGDGTTVSQVVTMLHIPDHEVSRVIVNSEHAEGGRVLQDGDVLHIFPLIDGG